MIALWLTIIQVKTYVKNEDSTYVKYKNFYDATQNHYPEFSICLLKDSIYQFNESKLPYNITSSDLGLMFNGYEVKEQDAVTPKTSLRNFLEELATQDNITYDDLLRDDLNNVIEGYRMVRALTVENEEKEFQRFLTTEGAAHFKKSFESNTCRCWTRQIKYVPGQVILVEGVTISSGTMLKGYFNNLWVTIHKKGQLLRALGTSIRVDDTMNLKAGLGKLPALAITINQIKLITRRHNANDECDPHLKNDDEKLLETTSLQMLGCIPIFWKEVSKLWKNISSISYCTDPKIYKTFFLNQMQLSMIYKTYRPPCAKISVTYDISTIEDDEWSRKYLNGKGDLLVKLMYKTEEYEEISNLKKFDAESLFSQVGGLIGIMIGASFFNIPDILQNMISKFKTGFTRLFFKTQLKHTKSESLITKSIANRVSECYILAATIINLCFI